MVSCVKYSIFQKIIAFGRLLSFIIFYCDSRINNIWEGISTMNSRLIFGELCGIGLIMRYMW